VRGGLLHPRKILAGDQKEHNDVQSDGEEQGLQINLQLRVLFQDETHAILAAMGEKKVSGGIAAQSCQKCCKLRGQSL